MQSPVLGYSAFSHFLQQHQQPAAAHSLLDTRMSTLGHDAHLPGNPRFFATSLLQRLPLAGNIPVLARCPSMSPASSDSPSPSCSPPASTASALTSVTKGKSFMIDAILASSPNDMTSHGVPGHGGPHPRFMEPSGHSLSCLSFHLTDSGASSPTDLSTNSRATVQGPALNAISPPRRPSTGSECAGSIKKTSGAKMKRVRTIFTSEQLERLEAEFERQQYMVGPERLYLAHALNLKEAQVKVWFQNRRIKWRKQHAEIQQQRIAAMKLQQQQQQQQQQRGQMPPQQQDVMEDSDMDSLAGDENTYPSMVVSVSTSDS